MRPAAGTCPTQAAPRTWSGCASGRCCASGGPTSRAAAGSRCSAASAARPCAPASATPGAAATMRSHLHCAHPGCRSRGAGRAQVSSPWPSAFRYLYETRYRDQPAPVLIVHTGQADVRQLPYDLLQAGRQLSLTLHDICPKLSYPVLRDFFRAAPDLLDALLDASRAAQGARLSEQRSLGFLARHVYGRANYPSISPTPGSAPTRTAGAGSVSGRTRGCHLARQPGSWAANSSTCPWPTAGCGCWAW